MAKEIRGLEYAKKLTRTCLEEQISVLDLRRCAIADLRQLPELFECVHIKQLCFSISENAYTDIPIELNRLKNLEVFSCAGSGVESFTVSFKPLRECSNLKIINTTKANLTDLEILAELCHLKELNLHECHLADIDWLAHLKNLEFLSLIRNDISDIQSIANLTNLRKLNLADNRIESIESLKGLEQLVSLNLFRNKIDEIEFFNGFKNLQFLSLADNQIAELKRIIGMTKLTELRLSANPLKTVEGLGNLHLLKELDIGDCELKSVPKEIFNLGMDVAEYRFEKGVYLGGNPIESPPMDIINQGREAVLDWFAALRQELKEIKVILVGEPKAGKTSLLRRLKDGSFDANEAQTDGVNIEDICFGESETFHSHQSIKDITGHFWDFGGQEIMNSTHQFFLTKRSVYILVLDARKDLGVTQQIRKWVKQIKATGGDSSIIVVANQIDVNTGFGIENIYELERDFPQIKAFIRTSCATEEGIEEIKTALARLIPQAELFGSEIDERWMRIKEKLVEETKQKYFLNQTRFVEICESCDLTEERQQQNAIHFLHDLGLVLHFDDIHLAEYFVLDPYWITFGVYQILTSVRAGELRGEVPLSELKYIVNEEEDKKQVYQISDNRRPKYSPNEQRFLVDILHQFKLCFKTDGGCKFIIPDLLDTSEPSEFTTSIREADDSIRFDYLYDYLPKTVMPNIMVDTHHNIEHRWRTGMVLAWNDCKALVSIYDPRISITVIGEHKKKREFLAAIRSRIDLINSHLPNPPEMQLPLPGTTDYVDYEEILWQEQEGKSHYRTRKYKDAPFEIAKLLDGVADQEEMRSKADFYAQLLLKNNHKIMAQNDQILSRLSQMPLSCELEQAIESIHQNQIKVVAAEITEVLIRFESILATQANELYEQVTNTDKLQVKVKQAVPLLNLLGTQIEAEFNLGDWAKAMFNKHQLSIFELMVNSQKLA